MNPRGIFCNRTLNMRAMKAIGYDMDYTLIHYDADAWERRAYAYLKESFTEAGWPVAKLEFDPAMVCRGLIIDTEKGNLVKANRFGFVKQAMHGTKRVAFDQQREAYSREIVDLAEDRWVFLNTLFSLSEGCMYAQLVDLLDARALPEVLGYADLYRRVKRVLDAAHLEGRLKAEIIAAPQKFVVPDPEAAQTLIDQKQAGKKLLLITNSEWSYTVAMMGVAFGEKWRELFDLVIVGARKPEFFSGRQPIFEVATPDGLLRPVMGAPRAGGAYLGGSAHHVEAFLRAALGEVSGDEILYVGDHMFGDVHVTKSVLRWRTALVLRELEAEVAAVAAFRPDETKLAALMVEKEAFEREHCEARLEQQRGKGGAAVSKRVSELRAKLDALDARIGPLARRASELSHPLWGPLMRAGNDKSHLASQMERYADIYTSRVSNLGAATPFVYLRSSRGSLPHDPGIPGPVEQYRG